ncbi:MAG: hypothetical protein ACOC88_04765, partial [Candidatus Bipolaricaulota bacterium]
AKLIKSPDRGSEGKIWLGLSHLVRSVRGYGGIRGIWKTVSRSAFSQLRNSFVLLLGTVIGLALIFLGPPGLILTGLLGLSSPTFPLTGLFAYLYLGLGGLAWSLMATSFIPIMDWYKVSKGYALLGPLSGGVYALMTIDSAIQWALGKGGNWKGRTYE